MATEKQIQTDIRLELGMLPNVAMFLNPVGNGVTGSKIVNISKPGPVMLQPGDIVIRKGRRVSFGLSKGSSDLIGWRTVIITADMVGKPFAQFTGLEVKTAKGRPSDEQVSFMDALRAAGGCAGIVRSAKDALGLVS